MPRKKQASEETVELTPTNSLPLVDDGADEKKSSKRRRSFRKDVDVAPSDAREIKRLLGGGS